MTRRPADHLAWIPGAIAVAILLLASPFFAFGDEESQNEAFLVAKGRVTFKVYCANCHGPAGVGDGPIAEYLKVQPADLTRISERHGGKFPRQAIERIVDGRDPVKTHGTREMPIWGDAFQKTLRPTWKEVTDEERANLKIQEVVAFLRSIQVTAD